MEVLAISDSPMEISIAEILDKACGQILKAWSWRLPVNTLHISPSAYELVRRAKARELERGQPLLLLGVAVVGDESVEASDSRLG